MTLRYFELQRLSGRSDLGPTFRPKVSLIIPTLNEVSGLEYVLTRIPPVVDEVIVVDAHSRDGTVEAVVRLYPEAVIVIQRGQGKGNALKEGLKVATGEIIITMDGDGSMDPADVPEFVSRLTAGYDFVKGSRELLGAGSDDFTLVRRAGNVGLTTLANIIFGSKYTDITFGFTGSWRSTIAHLGRLADGFQFEIQAALRAASVGMRTAEVPTHEGARIGGESKLSPLRDGIAILKIILAEASPRRATRFGLAADTGAPVDLERSEAVRSESDVGARLAG